MSEFDEMVQGNTIRMNKSTIMVIASERYIGRGPFDMQNKMVKSMRFLEWNFRVNLNLANFL